MPTPTKGPRLGGGPAHERLMLANLATSLFEHRRITTTEAKAKRLRPLAERMVTFAKRGDLHARRRVMTVIKDKSIVHVLFTEIAPLMAERPGGYTRITKVGPRKGDNAPMAVIELVLEPYSPKQATVKEAEAATKRSARGSSTTPAALVSIPQTPASDEVAAEAPADTVDVVADAAEGPFGADSAEPLEGGAAPDGFTIKGNRDSMKYHLPGGQWYDATIAEVWFSTEAAAVAAGFVPAGAAKAADAD